MFSVSAQCRKSKWYIHHHFSTLLLGGVLSKTILRLSSSTVMSFVRSENDFGTNLIYNVSVTNRCFKYFNT